MTNKIKFDGGASIQINTESELKFEAILAIARANEAVAISNGKLIDKLDSNAHVSVTNSVFNGGGGGGPMLAFNSGLKRDSVELESVEYEAQAGEESEDASAEGDYCGCAEDDRLDSE